MLLHCMYDDLEKYENKLKLKLKCMAHGRGVRKKKPLKQICFTPTLKTLTKQLLSV